MLHTIRDARTDYHVTIPIVDSKAYFGGLVNQGQIEVWLVWPVLKYNEIGAVGERNFKSKMKLFSGTRAKISLCSKIFYLSL